MNSDNIQCINCQKKNHRTLELARDEWYVPNYISFKKSSDVIVFQPDTLNLYLLDENTFNALEELKLNNICKNVDFKLSLYNAGLLKSKKFSGNNTKKQNSKSQNRKCKRLFLHVSHDCNLRCPYCYASGGNYGQKKQMMDLSTAVDSIKYVLHNEPSLQEISIDFFGGEPLLNYEVMERFIETIEDKYPMINFKYGIVTNGTIMNERISKFIKKNKFHVMITIDGPKEYHDLQRVYANGTGSFDILKRNLPLFKTNSAYLCARVVYTKKNKDLYKTFKYIYEELGIHDISYRPVMTELEEFKLDSKSEDFAVISLLKCFDYFIEKKLCNQKIESKFFSEQILNILDRKKKESFCDFGNFISITPEGKVYPCTHFVYNDEYLIGNIYQKQINNCVLDKCLKSCHITYEPCRSCWILGLCSGGCKGSAAFYNSGNIFVNDEYCKTRQAVIKKAIEIIVNNYKNGKLSDLKMSLIKDKDKTSDMSPNRWR